MMSSWTAQKGSVPPLTPLTLSGPLVLLSATSGTIIGATAGSTIVSNISGLVINSLARTYTWSGIGIAGLVPNALVETHPLAITTSLNTAITL